MLMCRFFYSLLWSRIRPPSPLESSGWIGRIRPPQSWITFQKAVTLYFSHNISLIDIAIQLLLQSRFILWLLRKLNLR
jgi:hypothetical protein